MESMDHPEKINEELVDSSCVCPTSTQFQGNAEDSPIDDYSALVHEETINFAPTYSGLSLWGECSSSACKSEESSDRLHGFLFVDVLRITT